MSADAHRPIVKRTGNIDMAVTPPEQRIWWNEPHRAGRTGLDRHRVPVGAVHVRLHDRLALHRPAEPEQGSLPHHAVRPTRQKVEDFAKKYTGARGAGRAGRQAASRQRRLPARRLWQWWPILELEKGQSYRIHLSSVDWQHGFSLQPTNINISGPSRLRARHHADADRGRRVRHHLQRILRDRPSHDDRQDPRHGPKKAEAARAPCRAEVTS